MSAPILATKLYIPPPRPKMVLRPRLIERLDDGLPVGHKLTLISAPAGFGKTTLASEWVAGCKRPEPKVRVAWLSLDKGDNDPTRFLTYLVAALQTIAPNLGAGVLGVLLSPQPPSSESILMALLNEITTIPEHFILVLDDYHLIEAKPVDHALTFLLEHLPPQMHLVIATREDPHLPLARLRAQGQLIELRAADLRFTPAEAAGFLNRVMGLDLSAEDIAALETRTEGWIAGLQLAALSMQGRQDTATFIKSFTGSHHFVLDYLVEQVLQQQSESVQTFLLRTSILDHLCGPLCDAVLLTPSPAGQETLEYLEHANLFIVPLDSERRWYRYHHLFAEFLQQRLQHSAVLPTDEWSVTELHRRASQWYEDNHLEFEAFHHAAAASDIERAERLIDDGAMPLHFPGAVTTILDWLGALPKSVLDTRPQLWARFASLSLVIGMTSGVEEKLQAAETALQAAGLVPGGAEELTDKTRDVVGQIAAARATLAMTRYQSETSIAQARRALEYLHPDNLAFRASTLWTLGIGYYLQGDRAAARRAFTDALLCSQAAGSTFSALLATISLGLIQELDNQLDHAMETYRRALQLAGEPALAIAYDAYLGMARIFYERNDFQAAQHHVEKSLELARQYDRVIDRYVVCEVFLARLKAAWGDVAEALTMLARTEQSAREYNFSLRLPEIAGAQAWTLLRQGNVAAAATLAKSYDLPLIQARVHLAQGNASQALALLEPLRRQVEAKGWADERLKVMVLQAVALHLRGDQNQAVQALADPLALAEPGGFIRLFLDEGPPMGKLLSEAAARGIRPAYSGKLLAAFEAERPRPQAQPNESRVQPLVEPLSQREMEVLRLIAQGLSNREIGERLVVALDTVKGHNRRIYDKLQVQKRAEAIVRARELGLL